MDWKRGFGVGLMLIGLFITLTSRVITGAVIGFQPMNYLGLLGIFIFIFGAFLILASGTSILEEKVKSGDIAVYDSMKGKKETDDESRYFMKDPKHIFTSYGDISLSDFGEMYGIIKDDPELLKKARESYGRELLSIVQEGDEHNVRIAKEFLKVLYGGKIPMTKGKEEKILKKSGRSLSKKELERIKKSFRDWKGHIDKRQRAVLIEYNLGHEKTGRDHVEIYSLRDKHNRYVTSATPSDYRTGRNLAANIIKIIERSRSES